MSTITTHTPLYLDYAATTPVDPSVAEKMMSCLTRGGTFANPASRTHIYGWKAEETVELARAQVAHALNADAREIVWTSGATEANNLALKGIINGFADEPVHLIVSAIEHKAVLDVVHYLAEQKSNVEVSYIAPQKEGHILLADIMAQVRDTTRLVSVMHANNETGVMNDIAAIGTWCRQQGILFHTDAAQTLGKVAIDVEALHVDLLSVSAHKLYGPKGVGALYIRRHPSMRLEAQTHGGKHERGMRSGTLATHQIVGFAEAIALSLQQQDNEFERINALRTAFIAELEGLPGMQLNGRHTERLPGIVNLAFDGVDGETLLMSLRELALSSGSACTSASVEPSYVLSAMGLTPQLAHSSLRFSFGRYTQDDDILFAAKKVRDAVTSLHRI